MAEYVSREDARRILCDVCGCLKCDTERCPFWQELDKLPVADVVERKHGKWEDGGFVHETPTYYKSKICSVCGYPTGNSSWPYCPICGAEMRGGEDGTN